MNFLAPTAFLFALTIPVVIVFYLLKRKRVVKLVSSTVLWQKFLAETQASAPFQRLRHNWLLILQILLLLLAILALARPYFSSKVTGGRIIVAILDASASPTHLSEALKLAQTLIQNNTKAEVHLFSDGASPNLNEFENKGLPLIY